jgi:peptide/nickel transport system substrate-binding protein
MSPHHFVRLPLALLLVCGAVALAACGNDDKARKGGAINIVGASFPDFLDPAQSVNVEGWQPLAQVYPGLLTFAHQSGAKGAEVRPALAEELPRISQGGLVYGLKLRRGLNFSDGRPVRASDFKASIERVVASQSQALALGYTNIAGAEEFAARKRPGIDGIVAEDSSGSITIRLVRPRGTFTYELALPPAGIVPRGTSPANQTTRPPPGAGRYVIRDVVVNRSFSLVKNPRFSPGLKGTSVDTGNVDRINFRVVASVPNATTQVARNQADFMLDNPETGRVAEIRRRYGDRYRQFSTPSVFYFFLNASAPPFDKLQVRQAANLAVDSRALERLYGGLLEPGHNIVPPDVPGHSNGDDPYPGPNVERARRLVREAGAEGAPVTVWGNAEEPTKAVVEYYADALNRIGLRARTRIVPAETYFQLVAQPSTRAQTGWSNWSQYPHPASYIDALLNPAAVGQTNFSNNASDQQLGRRIDLLTSQQLNSRTERQWAELDREIQQKAYWVPFGTRAQSTFFSERMDFENCRGDEWPLAGHDWARFCLKG